MLARSERAISARPVFIGWIALLVQLPFQVFFTLWTAVFFGSFAQSLHFVGRQSSAPFVFFGLLAFVGFPLVSFVGKKLNYSKTEYRLYPDRLEFEEGFFTINKKVIMFRDVKEVTLREGLLQRMYGLGTIYLATLATGSNVRTNPLVLLGFGNATASGVYVRDIRDPEQTYDEIKQVVDAQSASRGGSQA